MEKTIKLVMCEDKSLKIYVNDEEKHTISSQSKTISADKIYEIIDFDITDNYSVITENEHDIDNQVLECFKSLFNDIVNKVNEITEEREV